MASETFALRSDIFRATSPSILVSCVHENVLAADPSILSRLLATTEDGAIGLAPIYGPRCVLTTLALSTPSHVLVVRLGAAKAKKQGKKRSKRATARPSISILKNLLCHPTVTKYAFRMDRLSTSLFFDLDSRITNGVDLLSVSMKASRRSFQALMIALGGEQFLNRAAVTAAFKHEEGAHTSQKEVALQAWAALHAAKLASSTKAISKLPRINTELFSEESLRFMSKTTRDSDRLEALKPTMVKNDVSEAKISAKTGQLNLSSERYKTRIMTSSNQTIQIVTEFQGKQTGRAVRVEGRAATISLKGSLNGKNIKSVYTIGKEDPTSAESQRAMIVLGTLQRRVSLLGQRFVQNLFLPSVTPSAAASPRRATPAISFPQRPLNPSQILAVQHILSDEPQDEITVIQGPPGTGKTTVIAASVSSMMKGKSGRGRTMWLIAQSNVAVKNIAEKLADVGFLRFKLLVSKDFHFDWHEHLYEKIQANVIQSSEFPEDAVSATRMLLGSKVILCTLSMLSNPRLGVITRQVPLELVIVDEASQIEVGDYLPMLNRYNTTLRKLVFIGDDKQLAPYGQDDLGDLQSIFEIEKFRSGAIFLDTQYRMPVPIGNFISQHVYDGKLRTQHSITSPLCCRFVDIRGGKEDRSGKSWVNHKEVQAVMALAREMHQARKAYRIITPYDAQRNKLERALKDARLPWEDKCFNVDSFQGNEEDHIIISLVRSDKIGFLSNLRRTNVMLTRCKKGMFICTSRSFLGGNDAKASLMGKLAGTLGEQAWLRWP